MILFITKNYTKSFVFPAPAVRRVPTCGRAARAERALLKPPRGGRYGEGPGGLGGLSFLRSSRRIYEALLLCPLVRLCRSPALRVESWPKMVVFVNGMHIMKDRFPVALGSVIPQYSSISSSSSGSGSSVAGLASGCPVAREVLEKEHRAFSSFSRSFSSCG